MADKFPCSDLGNAERLVAWHGDDLRHVPAWGWLVWNGRVWQRGDKLALELAKRTIRRIYSEAADIEDDARRKALSKHALESESRFRISAMLALAESDPKIAAEVDDFDRNPMLLNFRNGTVDLRTGLLEEHRRDDLLALMIDLDYDPDARSELWDKFLEQATEGQDGLADFLRRAAGYTLTGLTREDAMFLPHGPGGTGKTTFVETVRMALGPYAGAIRIEVLTTGGRSSGGHNEDVARLVGKRMVTAVEASDNERLREGQVKHMTGGDAIPASLKHKPGFDFVPVLKLWLATNEVPYIRAEDTGMWRRVHKMPFENVHGKTDLKDRLKEPEHLVAILAWAVRGCVEWQAQGLQPPECVTVATTQLRRRMDGAFEQFIEEHCELGDASTWTATKEIRAVYTKWAEGLGIPANRRTSDRRVAGILRDRGCEPDRLRPAGPDSDLLSGWWGVAVLPCAGCAGCAPSSQFFASNAYIAEKSKLGDQPAQGAQNGAVQDQRGNDEVKNEPCPMGGIHVPQAALPGRPPHCLKCGNELLRSAQTG